MSMKIALAKGYIITTLLGALCPMQMAVAMSMSEPVQQVHVMAVDVMTLAVPMSVPMSMAPGHAYLVHTMPVGGNDCSGNHCLSTSQGTQEEGAIASLSIEFKGPATLPAVIQPTPAQFSSLQEPPRSTAPSQLAKIISTVVLIV